MWYTTCRRYDFRKGKLFVRKGRKAEGPEQAFQDSLAAERVNMRLYPFLAKRVIFLRSDVMRLARVGRAILIMSVVFMGFLYAEPKGKDNGKPDDNPSHNVENNNSHAPHSQADAHAVKNNKEKRLGIERRHSVRDIPSAKNTSSYIPAKQDRPIGRSSEHKAIILNELKQALEKLYHSRWAYNPQDERGQGNMGNVDMLDPYGHDKDSNRLELYGNRGRVIKESEPEPEPPPVPEPPPQPEPPPAPKPQPPPAPNPDPVPYSVIVPY